MGVGTVGNLVLFVLEKCATQVITLLTYTALTNQMQWSFAKPTYTFFCKDILLFYGKNSI